MSATNKATNNFKSNSKFTKKNAYPGAKKFTNAELYPIIKNYKSKVQAFDALGKKAKVEERPVSYMSFDTKNESKTAAMSENKVRYLAVLITDLENKVRPLVRQTVASITRSRTRLGKSDDGKIPSSASFSTRILVDDDVDITPDTDGKYSEAAQAVIDKIDELADEIVSNKFPDIPQDQFETMAEVQAKLLKAEYMQWFIEKSLSEEFERLLNDQNYRTKTIVYAKGAKHVISGNVQFDRAPKEDDPEDMAKANESGVIPLENPMVYYKIRIDKTDGSLWCRIYDHTAPAKGGVRQLATLKDAKTKKPCLLNHKNLGDWLRPNSVFTGICKYSLCISQSGARLHASYSEMLVRRAAKSEASSQVDEENADSLALFGGQFSTGDDDEDYQDDATDESDSKSAPSKANLTAVELQMAALAGASQGDF